MARQGLMDDSGYHGFDECNCYEDCTSEAYEQGRADAIEEVIKIAIAEIDFESRKEQHRFIGFMEQLKEQNK